MDPKADHRQIVAQGAGKHLRPTDNGVPKSKERFATSSHRWGEVGQPIRSGADKLPKTKAQALKMTQEDAQDEKGEEEHAKEQKRLYGAK